MKLVGRSLAAVSLAGVSLALADLGGAFTPPLTHPAIEYGRRPTNDAIAQLNGKLERGAARLDILRDTKQDWPKTSAHARN